jgi:hypothetical protein
MSALHGHIETTQLLLSRGANPTLIALRAPNSRDLRKTPRELVDAGNENLIKILRLAEFRYETSALITGTSSSTFSLIPSIKEEPEIPGASSSCSSHESSSKRPRR